MSQKKQQKGKTQQQKGKTPIRHALKYVLGSALLIGFVILAVYLYKREKEVETPTQQLEKFQTESPIPSNIPIVSNSPIPSNSPILSNGPIVSNSPIPSNSPIVSNSPIPSNSPKPSNTTDVVFDMTNMTTLKIFPNGPIQFPPNHVINIKVIGATEGKKGGIMLDTTNVKRSNEGYLPSFNVFYVYQSNTFTCNETESINLANEKDNISKGDSGGYKYYTGKNVGGMCEASTYAKYVITVPTDITYNYEEQTKFGSVQQYSNTSVKEGLIIDMTDMVPSNAACKCYGGKGKLLPSVYIQYVRG